MKNCEGNGETFNSISRRRQHSVMSRIEARCQSGLLGLNESVVSEHTLLYVTALLRADLLPALLTSVRDAADAGKSVCVCVCVCVCVINPE